MPQVVYLNQPANAKLDFSKSLMIPVLSARLAIFHASIVSISIIAPSVIIKPESLIFNRNVYVNLS